MVNRKRLTSAAFSLAMPAALAAAPVLLATPVEAQSSVADLRILSPRAEDTLASGSFALDVSFKSRTQSAIVTAELWVDGTRWVHRDLGAPQLKNVLSFDVDASTLSEGNHTFLVRVFDAAGGTSEKSVTLQLAGKATTPIEDAAFGPDMKFVTPDNNKRVSGVVELQLDAKGRNGANPYVTFYVDKQFKTLKNYPPYSFNWDSTTVENGYHTIEAMGYLDANNASTTRRVRVYVDNPGGNTTLKTDIPDLSRARQQAPVTAVQAAVKPLTIPIRTNPSVTARSAATLVANGLAAMHTELAPDVKTEVQALTQRVRESLAPLSVDVMPVTSRAMAVKATSSPRQPRPATHTSLKSAVAVTDTIATVKTVMQPVKPTAVTTTINPLTVLTPTDMPSGVVGTLARPNSAPQMVKPTYRPEMVAIKRITLGASLAAPGVPRIMSVPTATSRVSLAKPVQQSMVPVVIHKTSKAAPRAILRAHLSTLNGILEAKPLQIAFDGRQIAFDVRPRIEKGLPIAPFRQIFEHTGGQVMWLRQSHTVRAVNADREIIIAVGKKNATVNGGSLMMDRAATIEHGRTIVPLSFVKDALDVNIKYDAVTGHLEITSKN